MAALASLEFEVLLKPASGEPITVGGFVVELECEVPEDGEAMVRTHVDLFMRHHPRPGPQRCQERSRRRTGGETKRLWRPGKPRTRAGSGQRSRNPPEPGLVPGRRNPRSSGRRGRQCPDCLVDDMDLAAE